MIQKQNQQRGALKLWLLAVTGLFLSVIFQHAHAQTADVTISTGPTTGTHTATHRITLDNGFSADASVGTFGAIIVPSTLFSCGTLGSPSSAQNYIQTLIPRQPFTNPAVLMSQTTCAVTQTIQYIDGLGRPLQTVQVKGNNDGTKDLVQPVAYDLFGRETTKYLPYTTSSGTSGNYRSDALNAGAGVYSFYNPTGGGASGSQQSNGSGMVTIPVPSATTVFEPSPLNRPLEQGAPGDAWQPAGSRTSTSGRTVVTDYQVNNNVTWASDPTTSMQVALYTATVNSDASETLGRANSNTATYDAAQLTVTIVKDENWTSGRVGTTETYTDKQGHVVLKRTYNFNTATSTTEVLSTYYVYDDFGNLAFVLPPGVNPDFNTNIDQTALNTWCYQYRYDSRDRLVEKRIPGKDWDYTLYNKLDQVIATQDGNLRAGHLWEFNKYDVHGRVLVTGLWTNTPNPSIGRADLQSAVDAIVIDGVTTKLWEDRPVNGGRTNFAWPTSNFNTGLIANLIVNFYDDYTYPGNPYGPWHSGTITNPTGLLTATKTTVLNPDGTYGTQLWTVYHYDDRGRVAEVSKQHYIGGSTVTSTNNYDEVINVYNFDNTVFAVNRWHLVNNAITLGLANNYYYDHMGRRIQNYERINSDPTTLLSQVDYNEIGQVQTKHLHNVSGQSGFLQDIGYAYNERGWLTNQSSSKFTLNLAYNNGITTGALPQYNGNIAEMYTTSDRTAANSKMKYTYDALNRLTAADHSNNLLTENGITYDGMGNIGSLSRSGAGAANLSYFYNGNQLSTVNNNGSLYRSYGYDANGNATSDGSIANPQAITYNIVNLPRIITKNGSPFGTYTYGADGTKLSNATGGDGTWEYDDGIVFHNGSVAFITTEEGRAIPNGGSYSYQYNLKDHLGNSRVSMDAGGVLQEDEYYAFGLRNPKYDNSNGNRYLYNGKEIQTDLANQYDYGARFYDPVIARWTSVDPLVEADQESTSPYGYVYDDPIKLTDPDGRLPCCGTPLSKPARITGGAIIGGSLALAGAIELGGVATGPGVILTVPTGIVIGVGGVLGGSAVWLWDKVTNRNSESTEPEPDHLNGGEKLAPEKIKSPPPKRGDAPIGEDGKPVELHHREQGNPNSPVDEKTRADHREGDNYKKNHPNTNKEKSTVDRSKFGQQRKNHWKQQHDSGRFNTNNTNNTGS